MPIPGTVNPNNGLLKRLGNTPTEQTTRSFNIDPSGQFLIAAGQTSGNLAVFQINQQSGDLKRLHTQSVGKAPWWVIIR
ncbi:MAG: beta-propeller fold lactonase family protein [Planctomycetaceae bacterium]|nr:beta-propeller fold lactonase family protein [Planctomycetaceae bacterium]